MKRRKERGERRRTVRGGGMEEEKGESSEPNHRGISGQFFGENTEAGV